jgi:two-component system LytT family sensor kinase
MKAWMRPTKIEWVSYLTLMPVLSLVLNLLLFGNRVWYDREVWIYSFPLVIVQGLASWYLHVLAMHWLRVVFPDIKQTVRRLAILAVTHVCLTSLTFAALFYSYDATGFLGYELDIEQFRISLLVAIALTMVATTSWEADYTFKKWKDSVAEKQIVQQLTIQHEFETLKGQVNPHFLFNCFNTLSSLIGEDPARAEVFLNELSKVYRYLLRNNESGLSTLQNELKFIQSYFQLLKTRHGDAVQFQVEVDKRYESYLLPSLTLQLLVENAVKHNVLSRNKPLVIDIFTMAGNKLAVNNNLQRRTVKGPSNRIGLDNIRSKYDLLDQPGFQVLEDARNFTVILPLIWDNREDDALAVTPRNTENLNSNYQ